MPTALIGLGSNIAPETNLAAGVRLVAEHVQVTGTSAVYRTPPWGGVEQADFLNGILQVESDLEPLALLDLLQDVERRRKRVRTVVNGPRTLDLDLVAFGNTVLQSERLILPHPRLHERAFVLVPLCDVAPEWRHPVLGRTARDLLAGVDQTGVVRTMFMLPVLPPPQRGSKAGSPG
jgi:2-amino-4-hydroxy-6-hydroxymethyldihydropteridine diphosphokinase